MIYYRNECNNFDYEFEDILKLFYLPEEIIKQEEPWNSNSGAFLLCRINDGEKQVCLRLQAQAFDKQEIISLPQDYSAENKFSLKPVKKLLKRKLFLLLQGYTQKTIPWGVMTGIRPTKLVNELLDEGNDREEILNILVNNNFVIAKKAELLYEVAVNQRELFADSDNNSVSLYIGIPFCPTRCLYCSFSSSTIGQYKKSIDTYIETLLKELKHTDRLIKSYGFKLESIYIGGGTPTSVNAGQLAHLLEGIENLLDLSYLKEYTLEAGRPDTIDAEKLRVIKSSRVDRISINPQTMNSATLESIGRNHTPAAVREAFLKARELGFDNINMDVICGLPGEDVSMFIATLEQISELQPDSLTVHTMAIKRASRLTEQKNSINLEKEYQLVAQMVEAAQEFCKKLNLEPYYLYRQKNILGNLENVGYSKKGKECIYNIQIMEERQTILACGAGAVTKVVFPNDRIERVFNVKSVEEYIGRIDEMLERKSKLLELLTAEG